MARIQIKCSNFCYACTKTARLRSLVTAASLLTTSIFTAYHELRAVGQVCRLLQFFTPIHRITNVTTLIWVSIYHHVTLSNTITLNLSPTLTINPNTNHSPNPNKIIIINHTALRISLVTPRKSVCTGTVTHSDRRSDNFGQKLIPSDQRYERCVKKLIVVHDSPRM